MSICGVEQNYYQSSITEPKNTKSEAKKQYSLASIDPNKNYSTIDDYANDLYVLQAKLEKQYREITADSQVHTVEDLKREIAQFFPEFTFVSTKPRSVTEGKNLLYIDETNLQKMLNDPSYKSDVYALMKRELSSTNGFCVNGSAWTLTGTVFTLSEDNSKEGGIPYLGMCKGVRLEDSHTFSAQNQKTDIFSIKKKSQPAAKDKRKKVKRNNADNEKRLNETWEKERAKRQELREQIQQETVERQEAKKLEESRHRYQEWASQKYEEQLKFEDSSL